QCAGAGTWCPCSELFQQCDLGGIQGPATGAGIGVCEGACLGPDEPCVPALNLGYCFDGGESDPLLGAMPPWFLDNFCSILNEDLMCVQEPGLNGTCAVEGTSGN